MSQTRPATILVVDDTEANRYTLGRYLERAGFEVWKSSTGQEALALAARGPELALLDIKLPDLSGFEVCRQLKSRPETALMPVLLISSAHKSSSDKVRGLEAGADAYLPAPIDPEELVAYVRLLLRLRRKDEELRQRERWLEEKVEQRTAELAKANAELQAEMVRRETAEHARAALLRQMVSVQEEERRRIARELHDELGQHLTALSLGLKAVKDSAAECEPVQKLLPHLESLTNEMGQEVHRLAVELRPTALDDLGLPATLRNYVEAWSRRARVPADFQSTTFSSRDVTHEMKTTVYRMVQEALNNVAKHARATQVSVILERAVDQIHVIVEDNGCGFHPDLELGASSVPGRLGLLGMRERVALLGGALDLESNPGTGTTVFARLPILKNP